jgi:hypothetical protein
VRCVSRGHFPRPSRRKRAPQLSRT